MGYETGPLTRTGGSQLQTDAAYRRTGVLVIEIGAPVGATGHSEPDMKPRGLSPRAPEWAHDSTVAGPPPYNR